MRLLVTVKANEQLAKMIEAKLGGKFDIDFLAAARDAERSRFLANADVILAMNVGREINEDELSLLTKTKLIQTATAGTDSISYGKLRDGITVCSNGGAFSEEIAEHAIGMMLALARSFLPIHKKLSTGVFDQTTKHKMLAGANFGIVGYGGIGRRTAEIARAFDMKILAINSSGMTDTQVDFIGTLEDIDYVLRESDFILLSIALNRKTRNLINARELDLMKQNAVLVNVARGDLINEKDLYEHLRSHPDFKAGIEAWWIEPFSHPKFEIHYPFFELDSVLGSPHNSYLTENIYFKVLNAAAENILRFANGEPLRNVQRREDYL